eukprot:g36.t1
MSNNPRLSHIAACILASDPDSEFYNSSSSCDPLQKIRKHGIITIAGNTVFCPKVDMSCVFSFDMDVCHAETTMLTEIFTGSVAPLVHQVCEGENANLLITGRSDKHGNDPVDKLAYGMIVLASDMIYQQITQQPQGEGGYPLQPELANTVVRFSWFVLSDDEIVDVLAAASSSAESGTGKRKEKAAFGRSPDGHSISNNNHEEMMYPTLRLREDSKLGTTVPGQLQVEISNPDDLHKIIDTIQNFELARSKRKHMVLTLTLEHRPVLPFQKPEDVKRKRKSPKISTFQVIVFGSDIGVKVPQQIDIQSGFRKVNNRFKWRGALDDVLTALHRKSPTKPFHKSKLTLLLRDAISSRVHCGVLCVLSPKIDTVADSLASLKLAIRMRVAANGNGAVIYAPPSAENYEFDKREAEVEAERNVQLRRNSNLNVNRIDEYENRTNPVPRHLLESLDAVEEVDSYSLEETNSTLMKTDTLSLQTKVSPSEFQSEDVFQVVARGGKNATKLFTSLLESLESATDNISTLTEECIELRSALQSQSENATAAAASSSPSAQMEEAYDKVTRSLRKKLRKAEKELKDYEVYREVMESAVCRLQRELSEATVAKNSGNKAVTNAKNVAAKAKKKLSLCQKELKQLKITNQMLEDKIKTVETEANRAKQEKRAMQADLIELRKNLAQSEKVRKDSANAEMDAQEAAHQSRIDLQAARNRARAAEAELTDERALSRSLQLKLEEYQLNSNSTNRNRTREESYSHTIEDKKRNKYRKYLRDNNSEVENRLQEIIRTNGKDGKKSNRRSQKEKNVNMRQRRLKKEKSLRQKNTQNPSSSSQMGGKRKSSVKPRHFALVAALKADMEEE